MGSRWSKASDAAASTDQADVSVTLHGRLAQPALPDVCGSARWQARGYSALPDAAIAPRGRSTTGGVELLDLADDLIVKIGYECLPVDNGGFCRTEELRAATRLFAVCSRVQRCLEEGRLREAIRERNIVSEKMVCDLLAKVNISSVEKLEGKRSLNWAFLGINDADCAVIASLFEHGVLDACEGLHLSGSCNHIGDDGLVALSAGLAFAPNLTCLYLWGGDHTYGDVGCAVLAAALLHGKHEVGPRLDTLAVEGGKSKSAILHEACRKRKITVES